MKAKFITFVRGLKNGTPPRFQSYLKSLILLGLLTLGISQAWGENYTYSKVTSAPTDWSGTYILVYENNTTANICKAGVDEASNYESGTISSSKITGDFADYEIEIAKYSTGYSIKALGGTNKGKFLESKGSSSNGTTFANSASKVTTLSISDGVVTITNNSNVFAYNSASNNWRWRFFKSSTASGSGYYKPAFYKKEAAKTDVTLTPTQSSRNVDKDDMIEDLGSWFTIAPSAYDGTISYTSSKPSVFDVEDGVGFAYSAGTCSLYISASETTKYKAANCTISVTVNETCGNPITISKSPATLPSGCSFSLDKTSGCGDDAGESVLVTCSPATHYTVTAVNSTSGTPGPISSNQCTISGITDDALISVTFTEDTKYTITFADNLQHTASIPNTTNNEIVVYENETFTFPTIDDKTAATSGTCEQIHYHFMGWVLSTHEGTIAAGDIKTGTSDAVTAAATYYAVWAKEEL